MIATVAWTACATHNIGIGTATQPMLDNVKSMHPPEDLLAPC